MISPEIFRRYPFFSSLSFNHLTEIALISEIISFEENETIFEEGQAANTLFLLLKGSVDLYYKSEEEFRPQTRREFYVGSINPGEVFAISALIDPHVLNSSARAAETGEMVKIDAAALRELMEKDATMSCQLYYQAAKVIKDRLSATRVQLAACAE